MINILRKFKIEPQAIEQPLDLNVPENKIMLAIYLSTPEVENDRRSLNVISGMRRALKDGRWLGTAPKGYKNTRDDNNKPIIVPGKDAELIKFAFEQLATGHFNIDAVRKMVVEKGLNISRNGFWYLVRNCIYIGKIIVPAYKDEPQITVKAKHEPLVSESVFYDAQAVLEGRKRIGVPAHHSKQEDLPLRGFLKCVRCDRTITGSASKGNGGKFYYYHCRCGCKERYRAIKANESFLEFIDVLSKREKIIKSFEVIIDGFSKNSNIEQGIELQKTNKELETYRTRLENAQTLMLDGQIDASDYRSMKSKLEPEIDRLVRLQMKLNERNPEERKVIEFGLYFLRNMPKLFTIAPLDVKHRILGSTFPGKLVCEIGKVRTVNENDMPQLLIKPDAYFSDLIKKGQNKSDPLFTRVIQVGLFSNIFIEDLKKLTDIFSL